MKLPIFEFSRPLEVARISAGGSFEKLKADVKECAALAIRLKVPSVQSVQAELKAKPWRGGGVKLTGTVWAELEQVSVVSLESFQTKVEFEVERYFLSGVIVDSGEGEDVIDPINGGIIDLGEVVAETLALELDPYPRKAGEIFDENELAAEPALLHPFAKLKGYKPANDG